MAVNTGIGYAISLTLSNLDALNELHRRLVAVQRLAKEGAQFSVVIQKDSLDGIRDSVGRAVAAGVAQGGGRAAVAPVGSPAVGGFANDLGGLRHEIEGIRKLIVTLARSNGRGAVGGAGGAAGMAQSLDAAVKATDDVMNHRRREIEVWRRRAEGARRLMAQRDVHSLKSDEKEYEDLVDRAMGGIDALEMSMRRRMRTRLQGIIVQFGKARYRNDQYGVSNTLTDLRGIVQEMQGRVGANYQYFQDRAQNAMRDYNYGRNLRQSGGSSQGMKIPFDMTGVEAAFERAADKFADRLIARMSEGAVPGLGISAAGARGGAAKGGIPARGRVTCSRCGGTGIFEGGVCFKCGGTGDENNPDSARAMSAGARADWVGSATWRQAASTAGTGADSLVFAPHSSARQAELAAFLKRQEDKITKGVPDYFKVGASYTQDSPGADRVLNEHVPRRALTREEEAIVRERMQPYLEEYNLGGRMVNPNSPNPHLVNGMYVSPTDLRAMANNPHFKPTPANPPTVPYDAKNPVQAMNAHIQELNLSLGQLQRVNLNHLDATFSKLSEHVGNLKHTLKGIEPLLNQVGAKEVELQYARLLNDEKLRYKSERAKLEGDPEERRRVRAQEEARRLRQAARLSQMVASSQLYDGMSGPRTQKEAWSTFRRLATLQRRSADLELETEAMRAEGLPIGSLLSERAGTAARFSGLRNRFIGQMGLLAGSDASFAHLREPLAQHEAMSTRLKGMKELIEGTEKLSRAQDGLRKTGLSAKDKEDRTNAIKTRGAELLDMAKGLGVGIGPNGRLDPVALKKSWHDLNNELEGVRQTIVKLGQAQLQQNRATDSQIGMFDKFKRKLGELSYYAMAGGLLYGGYNMVRAGFSNAVAMESAMADVQGIFVTKTLTDRQAVEAGVRQSAQAYGFNQQQTAGIAKTFAQTGANPNRTLELTRGALLASRGAGLDPQQAVEMLIAVENLSGGRIQPTDIIDRISRVEARHSVTAQDLSTVLQRVGPLAKHMQPGYLGTTDPFDFVMGAATSIIEKTRVTGNQAGTSLRFMLSRLSAPEVQKKLQDNFGIALAEGKSTQMRPISDIMGDIAGKYKQYIANGDSGQAAALLTTFAGARQANAAAAMFDDWKSTMDVARESSLAFGDSQKRLAIQMDTLAVQTEKMKGAFFNFADMLLYKTGLATALKAGTRVIGGAFQGLADHPAAGLAVAGLSAVGIGAGLKALASLSALEGGGIAGLMGGSAGALGTALPYLGVVAAGGAAYMGTRALMYSNADRERMLRDQYGPMDFDRSVYERSEQGQAYAKLAGGYGLKSSTFYELITRAAGNARAAAALKFPEGGGLFGADGRKTNPELGRFLEQQFVSELRELIPGFSDIKEESEAVATGLGMLRQSLQYGGVGFSVQQAAMSEQTSQLAQDVRQAFSAAADPYILERIKRYGAGSVRIVDDLPNMRGVLGKGDLGRGGRAGNQELTYVTPKELGMRYSLALTQGRNSTPEQQLGNMRRILNSVHAGFGMGDIASNMMVNGRSMLSQALGLMSTNQNMTMGAALDELTRRTLILSAAESKALEVAVEKTRIGKELNAVESEAVRKSENFRRFTNSMESWIMRSKGFAEKQIAGAEASSTADGTLGAPTGGQFVDQVLKAYDLAARRALKKLSPEDPRYKMAEQFISAQEDPENRQRMKMSIIGGMQGKNLRAYLKDRTMDAILGYAQRELEIRGSSALYGGAGLGFDALAARASNSRQFLDNTIKVGAALPVDLMRAYHRLSLFNRQDGSVGGPISINEDAVERAVMSASLANETQKQERMQLSDSQKASLELQVAEIQRALRMWQQDPSQGMFATLPKEQVAKLLPILSLKSAEQMQNFGLTTGASLQGLAQFLAKGDLAALTGAQTARTRGLGNLQYLTAQRTLGGELGLLPMQRDAALAELVGDRLGSLNARSGLVNARRALSMSTAQSAYDYQLAELASNPTMKLANGEWAKEAFPYLEKANNDLRMAVLQANHEASRGILDLVTETEMRYAEKREQHLRSMAAGVTGPIADLLGDSRRMEGSAKFGELATAIGGTMQRKLASSFVDNMLGPEGILGKRFQNLFNNPMFQEAELIRQAHIQGITQGMSMIYGGGVGVAGGGSSRYGAPMAMGAMGAMSVAGYFASTGGAGQRPVFVSQDQMAAVSQTAALMGGLPFTPDGAQKAKWGQGKTALAQAAALASMFAGSVYGGRAGIKGVDGKPSNYAAEGASIGGTVGSMLTFIPGVGPFMPAIGGLLGGFLGGRSGKPKPDQMPEYSALERIERNTRETVDAVQNQTRNLLAPENRFLFVPTSFTVPESRPFGSGFRAGGSGTGGSVSISITVPGAGNPTEVAQAVALELKKQMGDYGTFVSPR